MTNAAASTRLASSTPSRAFVAIGFFVSTLVTAGLTTAGGVVLAQRQAVMNEQLQRVDAFTKTSQQFPGLVRSYSTALIEGKSPTASIAKLQENIVAQQGLLDDAEHGLSVEGLRKAQAYRETLADIQDLLDQATTAEAAGPILQPLANAVVERERVVIDLRRSAGLSAKPQIPS